MTSLVITLFYKGIKDVIHNKIETNSQHPFAMVNNLFKMTVF